MYNKLLEQHLIKQFGALHNIPGFLLPLLDSIHLNYEQADEIKSELKSILKEDKILRGKEAYLTSLIENTADLIWSVDSDYSLIYVNSALKEAVESLFNVKIDTGVPIVDQFEPSLNQQWKEYYDRAFASGSFTEQVNYQAPEGVRFYEVSFNPIKTDGVTAGVSVFARDITERKKTEQEILHTKDAAIAATKAKSEFLAAMSHEIRTPLNGIIAATALLNETPLSEEQMDYVNTIRLSGDALLAVIDDILDFSKIESGKMELDETLLNLKKTLEDAVGLLAPKASTKGVTIEYSIAPGVPSNFLGDVTKIRQILINLLSNAVKFTHAGSVNVEVSVFREKADSLDILFGVNDTGIGIPENKINRLFHAFSQVDRSTTRKYGGTGLGLVICKRLVHLMGGKIWVESVEGSGSSFYFTVNTSKSQVPAHAADKAADFPLMKSKITLDLTEPRNSPLPLKILIAEDNQINSKLALSILKKLGYTADAVENGALAVKAVKENSYDIVFMDIQMPEMDGLEASRTIRSEVGPKPVIIAMTANALHGDRERCLEAGMDDYLSKPVLIENIKSMLEKWGGFLTESAASAQPAPSEKHIIDHAAIDKMKDLDEEGEEPIIITLIDLFFEDAPPLLNKINISVLHKDFTALTAAAHSLKGIALSVAAVKLGKVCSELEIKARTQEPSGLENLSSLLDELYEQTASALSEIRNNEK